MKHDRFDGHAVGLFFYDEDRDWFAYFVRMPSISVFGNTPPQALDDLAAAWEVAKADYLARGLEIPIAPCMLE